MEYLKWNKVVAEYFFNPSKAGKEVLLYVTKDKISELGMKKLNFSSKEESWEDYCDTLRRGIKYTGPKLLSENIAFAVEEWKKYSRWIFDQKNDFQFRLDGILLTDSTTSITYPLFIAFIPALIIPFTENNAGVRANSYYTPLSDFLIRNNISKTKEDTASFSKIEPLWALLEKWSTVDYRTDLGIFKERNFGNPLWKHVGKPFSQCILTPKNIRDIPKLFWTAGIAPFAFVSQEMIARMVVRFGTKHAGFNTRIAEIMSDINNPLRKVICDIIKREYESWTGEVLDYDDEGQDQIRIKSGWSYGTLLSAFSLSHKNEAYEHFYHLYSKSDIPDDLYLNGHQVIHLTNGYSERINQQFDQQLIWTDNENKWRATPSPSNILLYISGSYFGLPSDTYIETDKISRASKMYLLCPAEKRTSVEAWGTTFTRGDFKLIDYDYIPPGFSLYEFKNPVQSHPEEEALQINSQKNIEVRGGIKMANREYLNVSLPEIWLTGADGKEKLFLEYMDNTLGQTSLEQSPAIPEVYFFPATVQPNREFRIVCDLEDVSGSDIPYKIIDSNFSPLDIIEENLVKRNKRGEPCQEHDPEFVRGSNTMYTNWSQQLGSVQDFLPLNTEVINYKSSSHRYDLSNGNLILEYLTLKRNLKLEDFSSIMDNVANKSQIWRSNTFAINPKYLKQQAISYYDYAGYLDYDYSLDKITINKPQIVIIPSKKHVEAILIGGRTHNFVNDVIAASATLNINIEIHPQVRQLERFLLPDTIKLIPAGCSNSTQSWMLLKKLAEQMHIVFYTLTKPYACPQIVQFGLQDFGENLKGYKLHLVENKAIDLKDFAWARKTFNPASLFFERDAASQIDKNLSLHEYYLQYKYKYVLWLNGISYEVDRNWGRFLLLAELKKQVVFYEKDSRFLIIPKSIQLPRLIAESITLLSGFTPTFKKVTLDRSPEICQVYQNVPKLFAENLFKKLNQTVQYIIS